MFNYVAGSLREAMLFSCTADNLHCRLCILLISCTADNLHCRISILLTFRCEDFSHFGFSQVNTYQFQTILGDGIIYSLVRYSKIHLAAFLLIYRSVQDFTAESRSLI